MLYHTDFSLAGVRGRRLHFSIKHGIINQTCKRNSRKPRTNFAEKAEISYGIYAKWETAVRQPSRKMYQQLVTTYPEINI